MIRGNEAGVLGARANLLKANKDLSRTSVLAPMDGVVSLLNVKKGERVVGNSMMAGTEMLRVADMSVIEVIVDVGENDIPKVSFNDSAIVEIDAYNNRKFKGLVTKIASSNSTAAQSAAASTNDVTNYKVHIRLLRESYNDLFDASRPKNFPFRPGMSASADIQTTRHENVLSVPINAITTREKNSDKPVNNKKDVNVQTANTDEPINEDKTTSPELDEVAFILLKEGTVKKINVRTDIQDINHIEVLSGLKEGDMVITGPYSTISKLLKDGMKVIVTDKDKLFEVK